MKLMEFLDKRTEQILYQNCNSSMLEDWTDQKNSWSTEKRKCLNFKFTSFSWVKENHVQTAKGIIDVSKPKKSEKIIKRCPDILNSLSHLF